MTKATTANEATTMEETTMATQYEYGVNVVEFFKHCDEDLQQLIDQKQAYYNNHSEGLHHKGMAAHIDWVRHKPLEVALIELQDSLKQGYELVKAFHEALYFKAILKKPAKQVKAELLEVAKLAREEYDNTRYELNAAETERQINISVFQKKRAREAAAAELAAKAAAALQHDEEASALADLLRAYAEPAEAAAELEQAA